MTFPNAIQKDRGEPSKVRIGTVAEDGRIMLQETVLDPASVGIIGSYTPVLGDSVALLGQSAVGTSATSWLVLGRVEPADTASPFVGRSLVHQQEATATNIYDFSAAGVNPPGMSFSFDLPPGTYEMLGLMTLDAELQVASNISGIGRFIFNGAAQTGEIIIVPRTALVRYTNSSFWMNNFTLTESTTITVDAFVTRVNGADGQLTGMATHSKIGIQIFR